MAFELILILFAGLLTGGIAAWLVAKARFHKNDVISADDFNSLKNEKALLEQRYNDLQKSLNEIQTQLNFNQEKITGLNIQNSKLETLNSGLNEKLQDHKKELELLHSQLKEQFEAIASKVVMGNSQMIQQQHSEKLNDLLNPLKEKIEKFENTVTHTHKENIRENQSLKEQLKMLQDLNKSIGEEARNLTSALKGQVKTQGNWGELILETILEKSGLVKDREYFVQSSHTSEDGRRLQPDVLVKLPENKVIIVDSKVSLVAYEKFSSAEDKDEMALALKDHLSSIRKHIKGLGDKNYHQIYEIKSLDFVLLFIPIEPAFSTAVQYDNSLFNDAFENNIVIVSPSTLLATLRTISSIWKLEYQNKNALEIARQSGALYDKFVGFLGDFQKVGDALETSKRSWDGALNKLSEGRGNLVTSVEKLKKLGAAASKSISANLLSEADEDGPDGNDESGISANGSGQ